MVGNAAYDDKGKRCREAFQNDYFNHAWKQFMAQSRIQAPSLHGCMLE